MSQAEEHAAIITFHHLIDDAEAGKWKAVAALRLLLAEATKQAPPEDVIAMAELILKSQRAAYAQNYGVTDVE